MSSSFADLVGGSISRRGMLTGGERVLVAVSGGPDSLALLHALVAVAPRLRLDLAVAHFDHRLREGSGADAAFVAAEARRLGLRFALGEGRSIRAPGRSIEEEAREQRLAFLEEAAGAFRADRIATGHTMDDQAETVLMRLVLGSGRRGLGAIPPVRERWIRPLIDVRRAETEAFCDALGLDPRRDPTNDETAFLRNAIRAELIPLLSNRFNARVVEALARAADTLREEEELLEDLAAKGAPHEDAGGETRLQIEALRALPAALQRVAIRAAVSRARERGGQPASWSLDASSTERVRHLALGAQTGRALDLAAGLKVRIEYGWLLLGSAPQPEPVAESVELRVPGETDLPPWSVSVVAWFGSRPAEWPDGRGTCVVDADRLTLPLTVRASRRGDRVAPLGLAGTKSVADLLADAKVPSRERRVPLVVDGGGEIVWVVGHRVAAPARVTDATTRFLWLESRREGPRGAE